MDQGSESKDAGTASSETGSTLYTSYPEMTSEQEFFLYELETADTSSLGLVLRAIYDTGNVHNFSRALERRIAHYDRNILKVCTYHYQGFLDSVSDLSSLGSKGSAIKEAVQQINDSIRDEGAELDSINAEIVHYKKLQRNAAIAVDQVSMCLPVLDSYVKLNELMGQKKYLPALKVLEELEHNYIPLVNKYRFTQTLSKMFSPVRKEIKDKSYSELKDFLENLQKVCGRIGEEASKKIGNQYNIFKQNMNTKDNRDDLGKADADDDLNPEDKIDYGPIHSCCQVFSVLGEKESFERYYREQRREQIDVCADGPKGKVSLTSYVKYLNEVMGFFIVEDTIMRYEPSLVTAAHKAHLWEIALQKVTFVINSNFGNCLDVATMLKIKKIILVFIFAMKSYDYDVLAVYSLLQNFRDQYNEVFMAEYCKEFELALQKDNFAPLVINDEQSYKAVLDDFPVIKRGPEPETYPRTFPFSEFVPKVYRQAKQYLVGCLGFMDNLRLSQTDVEETIRNCANRLLERWTFSIKSFMSTKKGSLVHLIQITINMGHLEKSCDSLDRYITKITSHDDGIISSSHLESMKCHVFHDAQSEVEELIGEALKDRVSEFLDLACYNWELSESNGVSSDYVTDLVNFLGTTFKSFTNLPDALARHICLQTCKYLADRLLSIILSSELKAISRGALEQFNLDVMQCELFASSRPVSGLDDQILPMTFSGIRQLLDLVMNEDWSTYLAQRGQRSNKYIRVTTENAVDLLEKIMEFDKRNSGFFGTGRTNDRRKLYETIIRQLRHN